LASLDAEAGDEIRRCEDRQPQGVRIPKVLLEEAGIAGPVDIRAEEGRIVLERIEAPRAGWEEAAQQIAAQGGDELLLGDFPNVFDKDEWTW
jgi:antitoxin MazE